MSKSVAVRASRTSCSPTMPSHSCRALLVNISARTHTSHLGKSIMKHHHCVLALASAFFFPGSIPCVCFFCFFNSQRERDSVFLLS